MRAITVGFQSPALRTVGWPLTCSLCCPCFYARTNTVSASSMGALIPDLPLHFLGLARFAERVIAAVTKLSGAEQK